MKKVYIILILFVAFMVSCSKDFLEKEPIGKYDSSVIFQDEALAESVLIGAYDLLQHTYAQNWNGAWIVKLLPADDSYGGSTISDQPNFHAIDEYDWASDNPVFEKVYENFYNTIGQVNEIINNTESSTLSNANILNAESKFLRAWCFFELTTMFGEVPLRLQPPTGISEEGFALPFSSQADIYNQIEEDLTSAIAGLPTKGAVAAPFRVSKAAANALMGKLLVFAGRDSEAIPFLNAAIADPDTGLVEDFDQIWRIGEEYGKESLFELGYETDGGYTYGNIPWSFRIESNIHIQLMGNRGLDFGTLSDLQGGWGWNRPTAKIGAAFDAVSDVERKNASLISSDDLVSIYGGAVNLSDGDAFSRIDPNGPITVENTYGYDGLNRLKYTTRQSETSESDGDTNRGTNWRLLRLGEVYLLAAEAEFNGGTEGNALGHLNTIKLRSGVATVNLSGPALLQEIKDEKFRELAWEGQRYWDLVRWGDAATEIPDWNPTLSTFPIPQKEIDLNQGSN
ncbi:SusD-like starch-binding protein associating with outer membrane [Tenacibaculum adriaticum]|uniref:SusD-like starch-binding protein associating with outer membrane n=1 Tax=Tenacibaculum adriaticum TaxID=413713 RepID=A0A5S5DQF4_9FLAO|nr:RagB/SusD family nutrient uptake outer membrane protein [Tenacibaculum adriaticum]TYP98190.1 SusD-like starch-binding protein associating with outer membrane [Tenacibaculum adriaticum]